jgi:hypothetical protein
MMIVVRKKERRLVETRLLLLLLLYTDTAYFPFCFSLCPDCGGMSRGSCLISVPC